MSADRRAMNTRGTLNAATQRVGETFAGILRRRTGRTWVVVAGSVSEADRDALGGRDLRARMRGAVDIDDVDPRP
jgi:hypothetical protein